MNALQPVDFCAYAAVAAFAGIGLWRGISGEIANACGLLAALFAGLPVHRFAASFVSAHRLVEPGAAERIAAWVASLAACLGVFGLVYRLVARFVSFLVPQPTNAIMGLVLGAAKGVVLCALALGFARAAGIDAGVSGASAPVRMIDECASRYADLSAPR